MQTCVGVLQQAGQSGRVIFDRYDPLLGKEAWIDANNLGGAPFGMKVVCELLYEVTEPVDEPPRAKIIEVLGDPGNRDVAMLSIIRQHHLPETFPVPVMEAAQSFPLRLEEAVIRQELKKGRADLRDELTITIDGEEAKDLDDAIHIKKMPDGRFELGVHIADVTHYVKENEILDLEAFKRGTSVYLVDRVIPMLPPRLSNGICSLNPDQDRLTLSAIMTIDNNGEIIKGHLQETIIRSHARSSYREVKEALETSKLPDGRPPWFLDAVNQMYELSEALRKKRLRRGTIEFEFPETHVELDEEGRPLDIYPYPISFANGIIEEFMIAANEFVAEKAEKAKLPFLYRVHELPDPEKLDRFIRLANILGLRIKLKGAPSPGKLAQVLESVKTEPFGQTLSQLLLRSLAKARYAPDNLGHFGLASSHYCHFTSPIRRYPDLFIHRVLKAQLHDALKTDTWKGMTDNLADHTSDTERNAMYAERDSVDQKASEFFSERIGEVFSGIISGFNKAGIYIQLENTAEGMVPFRTMDGYISYEEERLRAVNETAGHIYSIGDPVVIQVAQADTVQRRVDFEMIEHMDRKLITKDSRSQQGDRRGQNKKNSKRGKSGAGKKDYAKSSNKGKNKKRKNKRKNK